MDAAVQPARGACALAVEVVVAFFGLPAAPVAVTAGTTSRRKTVTVHGLDPDAARARLRDQTKL